MKKVQSVIKPFLAILIGALLFLYFLNNLSGSDAFLAEGIIGVIVSILLIGSGVVVIILGDKLPELVKKILELSVIGLFSIFLFTLTLINLIQVYDAFDSIGTKVPPTGWVVAISGMIVYLSLPMALIAFYILIKLLHKKIFVRFATLISGIFAVVALLSLLFQINEITMLYGQAIVLGNIDVIFTVIMFAFCLILCEFCKDLENMNEEPTKEEKPAEEAPKEEPKEEVNEEPKEEEQPAEESQAE